MFFDMSFPKSFRLDDSKVAPNPEPLKKSPHVENGLISRRQALKFLMGIGAATLIPSNFPSAQSEIQPVKQPENIDSLSSLGIQTHKEPESIDVLSFLNNLEQKVKEVFGSSYSGFSLKIIDSRNRVLKEVSHNPDKLLPVASAFKSAALLYYLTYVSPEEWVLDKGSTVYNSIVYSHNNATGDLIHEAAESQRKKTKFSRKNEFNDLELFNDFLSSLGLLGGWVSFWGFNSKTSGQSDTRYSQRSIVCNGKSAQVSNLVSAEDLSQFYLATLDDSKRSEWQRNPQILAAFRYLSGIIDPQYQSPLEESFYGSEIYGKDGYLEKQSIPGFGSAIIDAGIIHLSNGMKVVVSAGSFDASETIIPRVYQEISISISENLEIKPSQNPSEILNDSTREKIKYFFPSHEMVQGSGVLQPSRHQVSQIQEMLSSVEENKKLGGIVTVNLFDGSVALFETTDFKSRLSFIDYSLVGRRLSFGEDVHREEIAYRKFSGGTYLSDGVLVHNQGERHTAQHTISFPMVGLFIDTHSSSSFGGINAISPTPFWINKLFVKSQEGYQLSALNSEQTIHAVPKLSTSDQRYNHFSQRNTILNLAKDRLLNGSPIPRGYDPYWSSGCVNLSSEGYESLTSAVKRIAEQGKAVVIVCSYQNQRDWHKLVMPEGLESRDHIMFAENYSSFLSTINE